MQAGLVVLKMVQHQLKELNFSLDNVSLRAIKIDGFSVVLQKSNDFKNLK